MQDYIRVILNLNQTETLWSLSPTVAVRDGISGFSARGTGNAVSVEFNILYRWHAAISENDEKWIEGVFREHVGDKPFDELTKEDFGKAVRELGKSLGSDKRKWEFGGLKRDATTGRFNDADVVKILSEATDDVAGAFGARGAWALLLGARDLTLTASSAGSPACMRIIDVLGIAQARNDWNTCSLNEFRRFLNLKTFETFEGARIGSSTCRVLSR